MSYRTGWPQTHYAVEDALEILTFCFHLPSSRIKGVCCHTQFVRCRGSHASRSWRGENKEVKLASLYAFRFRVFVFVAVSAQIEPRPPT